MAVVVGQQPDQLSRRPTLATDAWLVGLGPATTIPLLLFAVGRAPALADHAWACCST